MNSRGFVLAALPAVVLLLAAALTLPATGTDDMEPGKLWLEFSLGWQSLDPVDLNLAVDADESVQRLRYDHYLQSLQDRDQILSWSATAEGGRRRITSGWQLEPRLRYRLGASFSLSAAVRVQRGGGSQNLLFEFTRVLAADDRYVETLAFIPYRLSVQSFWPNIGIHFRRPIGRQMHAAGHVAAGPLFAGVSYRSAWTYAWDMRGSNYTWPVFRDAGERSEKGTGTGFGLELGARLERALGNRLAVFLQGGYIWQEVNAISGSGRETRAEETETWSGKWVSRGETIIAPWETLAISFPTCRPRVGADDRPFRLDLSGWQLRAGFSWRL
jgi:hypothetical protein